MADTVKKSRIVSEEEQDLEEALLEEFNIRLKNCMSQDDLQKDAEPPEPDEIYETIPSPQKPLPKGHILATESFLQTEINQENHYDEPRHLLNNGSTRHNGHHDISSEEIYENIQEKTENQDQNYVPMLENKNEASKIEELSPQKPQHQEYEQMGLEETTSNLYESVELKPQPQKLTPTLNLPTTFLTDYSDQKSPDRDSKPSAKDRMLLSDETSTLLFTQTVTSPMLTPSEENIDFLKGFQRDNTISDSTVSNISPPKDAEEKLETTETSPDVTEPLDEEKENYYENTEYHKNTTPENTYENLILSPNPIEKEENIYEHLEDIKTEVQKLSYEESVMNTVEDIYQNIDECFDDEKNEIVSKHERKSQDTDDGSLEEFIRNEREVTESFMVGYKSSIHEEPSQEKEEEEASDLDVVDEAQVSEMYEMEKGKAEEKLEKSSPVLDKGIEESRIDLRVDDEDPSDIITMEEMQNVENTLHNVEKVENTCQDTYNNVYFVTNGTKTTKQIQEHHESIHTAENEVKNVSTKEKISTETYKELIYHQKLETSSNYCEKYTEVVTKSAKNEAINNREKDTETVPAEIVKNLKSQFQNKAGVEVVGIVKKTGGSKKESGVTEMKSANLINQIKTRFEAGTDGSEEAKNVIDKSSFSKFDALQKKNVLHVRSSDSTKAQEKFSNGAQIELSTSCKACGKQVFQMEQIKAERALWHKNCFRCTECSKQLTVDTYESNDGSLYCKPHFKALFAPKAVEDEGPPRPRRIEPIIRENQPVELPPDVVRASDKPDLGLEELQSLNVKERFQVFEHYQQTQQTENSTTETERGGTPNVKRSPSILSKLARFQKHGMDVGVSNEALDGVPIEESSSEEEVDEEIPEGEDPDLVRARRVQKEKPFHFTGMSDVKKRWEQGDHAREERREETKQEIQNIRTKLFMGKQEKMKEAYQNAVMVSESSSNLRKNISEKIEACDTKSIKERFEKGEVANERINRETSRDGEEEIYESEISKNSRSLFLELDASASKPPQVSPVTPTKLDVKKAREAYLEKTSKEDTVKSTEQIEEVEVRTADIQERFKFFETYKEPEKEKRQFRITPPRDPSQVKTETPEREIYRDPEVVRAEEYVDDSKIATETHTASKMLSKFREMEENLNREPEPQGLKPLKCFTPPPEPARPESRSEGEESSEYEEEEEEVEQTGGKLPEDLIEAQKAARAKQLRAKFEKWEVNEIKREQQNSVNVVEETGEEQQQIESTRVLRARFEQMKETSSSETSKTSRVKPNRFV